MSSNPPQVNTTKEFMRLLPAFIIAYILIDLWGKVISTFTTSVLHLRDESLTHNFIIAIIVTIILFLYLWFANDAAEKLQNDIVPIMPSLSGNSSN